MFLMLLRLYGRQTLSFEVLMSTAHAGTITEPNKVKRAHLYSRKMWPVVPATTAVPEH